MMAPVIGSVSAVVTLEFVLVPVVVEDVTVPPRRGARDEAGVTYASPDRGACVDEWREEPKLPRTADSGGDISSPTSSGCPSSDKEP